MEKKCAVCGTVLVEDAKFCASCGNPEGSIQNLILAQNVSVVDIKMPFTSMVAFMVKSSIAAIPALIILFIIGLMVSGVFMAMFGAFLPFK